MVIPRVNTIEVLHLNNIIILEWLTRDNILPKHSHSTLQNLIKPIIYVDLKLFVTLFRKLC